jgi:hypothetical protein
MEPIDYGHEITLRHIWGAIVAMKRATLPSACFKNHIDDITSAGNGPGRGE